jgi:thiol-disulfide isomerase/thioredoxin
METFIKNLSVVNFIMILVLTVLFTLSIVFIVSKKKSCQTSQIINYDMMDNEQLNKSNQLKQLNKSNQLKQLNKLNQLRQSNQQNQPNQPNQQNQSNPKLTYYYSERCGHCKSFKQTWNTVKENNELNIDFEEINCNTNMNKCSNISGYPTIILTKSNNTKVQYDDYPRTEKSLKKFILQNL